MKTQTYTVNNVKYLSSKGKELALNENGFKIKTKELTENKITLEVNGLTFTTKWKEVLQTLKSTHLLPYKEQLLRARCINKVYVSLILNK